MYLYQDIRINKDKNKIIIKTTLYQIFESIKNKKNINKKKSLFFNITDYESISIKDIRFLDPEKSKKNYISVILD